MSTRKAVAVIAGLVLVVGLVLLGVKTSVAGGVECGTAFAPDNIGAVTANYRDALRGDDESDYGALCEARIFTQRLIGYGIASIGILALLFVAMTSNTAGWRDDVSDDREQAAPQTDSAP